MNFGKGNEIVYQDEKIIKLKCSNCDDVIIIDTYNFDKVKIRTWHKENNGYPVASFNGKDIKLHRYLMKEELNKPENEGKVIDHIDRNKLNNTMENLRIVDLRINNVNSAIFINSEINLRGVSINGVSFQAEMSINGKNTLLGVYKNKYDAAIVCDSFIYHNTPESEHEATNIKMGKIPQEILDEKGINPNDLSTIPFIPSHKKGSNKYYGVYYNKNRDRYDAELKTDNGKVSKNNKNEIIAVAIREQYLLDHPELLKLNKSNVLWPDVENGKEIIAGIILTKDEMEEKTRGY